MFDQYDFICKNCYLEIFWHGPISRNRLADLLRRKCPICGAPLHDYLRVPNVPILEENEYQMYLSNRK